MRSETRDTQEVIYASKRGTGSSAHGTRYGRDRWYWSRLEDSKLVRGKQIMSSATVVRIGYAAMMQGTPVVIPGTMNRLQALAPRFLPRRLMPALVRRAQEREGS